MSVTFGQRLTKLRNESGYTQEYMASIIGVSYVAYGNYERDKSNPKIETIRKICKEFNVSADYLLGLSKSTSNSEPNISAMTGLSEYAVEFLKKAKDQGVHPKFPKEVPLGIHINDIISMLLEDADSSPMFVALSDALNNSNSNDLTLSYYDYLIKSHNCTTEEEYLQYLENEKNKAMFLNNIISYLMYERDRPGMYGINEYKPITIDNAIILSFGDDFIPIPSKKYDETVETMLTLKVMESLKKLKEIFIKRYRKSK